MSLADCSSVEAMVSKVAKHAAAHPELSWLVGIGWDQSRWGRYPTKADLDGIRELEGRPCWLWRACWHIGVANSAALERAGISGATAVSGGIIDKDASGAPSGLLRERACDGMAKQLGEANPKTRAAFLSEAVWQCAASGLTCVHTHEFGAGWSAAEAWDLYRTMQGANRAHS